MESHMKFRRSSGVEGEVVEEEEFVGTGEVVRIEKTEEVIIIIIIFFFIMISIAILLGIFTIIIKTSPRFQTIPSVMRTL